MESMIRSFSQQSFGIQSQIFSQTYPTTFSTGFNEQSQDPFTQGFSQSTVGYGSQASASFSQMDRIKLTQDLEYDDYKSLDFYKSQAYQNPY
jgi:hypothetical protein